MKSGQCPKCGSRDVFCNTNRKFPGLHTITVGSGSSSNRYAPLDIYICVSCGYVESYIAHTEDLSYIKEEWALVKARSDRDRVSIAAPEELPDTTRYLQSSANGNPYPSPNPSEERSTGNGNASGSATY